MKDLTPYINALKDVMFVLPERQHPTAERLVAVAKAISEDFTPDTIQKACQRGIKRWIAFPKPVDVIQIAQEVQREPKKFMYLPEAPKSQITREKMISTLLDKEKETPGFLESQRRFLGSSLFNNAPFLKLYKDVVNNLAKGIYE